MSFGGGGFLGGGAKQSSTVNTTTTQEAGFSEIGGQAVSLQGEGNVLELSDHGAIDSAFGFAGGALQESLRQVELAGSRAGSQISDVVDKLAAAGRTETENLANQGLKWAALVAVALGAFWMVAKLKGK